MSKGKVLHVWKGYERHRDIQRWYVTKYRDADSLAGVLIEGRIMLWQPGTVMHVRRVDAKCPTWRKATGIGDAWAVFGAGTENMFLQAKRSVGL